MLTSDGYDSDVASSLTSALKTGWNQCIVRFWSYHGQRKQKRGVEAEIKDRNGEQSTAEGRKRNGREKRAEAANSPLLALLIDLGASERVNGPAAQILICCSSHVKV